VITATITDLQLVARLERVGAVTARRLGVVLAIAVVSFLFIANVAVAVAFTSTTKTTMTSTAPLS